MSAIQDLKRRMSQIVGEEQVASEAEPTSHFAVDDVEPAIVVSPGTDREVADALSQAASVGVAVIPWGGGTRMARGHIPQAYDVALTVSRMDQIVDHDVANLTVTTQVGITMARLQAELAREGQFLPIDAPLPDRATVGGVVASNTNGPSRVRHGSVRDLVLGLRAAMPSGAIIHAGGKTVKNVAGYDMSKLLIGSYGTLGVITEVTFRLLPLPARSAVLRLGFADLATAHRLAAHILDSVLLPTHLTLVGPDPEQSTSCTLVIGVDGSAETVARQVTDMTALARDAGAGKVDALNEEQSGSLNSVIRDFPSGAARLAATCTVPLSETPSMVRETDEVARRVGLTVRYCISVGAGIANLLVDGDADSAALAAVYEHAVDVADRFGGHCVLDRAEPAIKRAASVWGRPRDDWRISEAIKHQLDPNQTLNPGRFVGRL